MTFVIKKRGHRDNKYLLKKKKDGAPRNKDRVLKSDFGGEEEMRKNTGVSTHFR